MSARLTRALLAAACFAALLAGCGGDDSETTRALSTSTALPEVTREHYIANADAFCKEANARARGATGACSAPSPR